MNMLCSSSNGGGIDVDFLFAEFVLWTSAWSTKYSDYLVLNWTVEREENL